MEPPLKKLNITEFRGEDRISQLPDPILHSILSRLSTRNALPTMLLSKRWKELWASMPYFYISEYNHSAEAVSNYVRFLDSLLLLCDQSDIQSFWLGFSPTRKRPYGGLKQQHLNKWIGHLVRRNVKRLQVQALLGEAVTLPSCLFSCPSLQDLKLVFRDFNVKLTAPEFLGLGRLKKLCVTHITFDCDSLKKIISGCPVLEDLNITRCELGCLDISSDSIKTLSILNCEITGSIIRISSPRARQMCFRLNKANSLEVCLGNLSSLVDASIQVDNCYYHDEEVKPLKFVISRNKNSSGDSALSTFPNLKKLKIGGRIMSQSFPVVVYFFDRSPNLEQLCLYGSYGTAGLYGRQSSYTCAHIKRKIVFHCGVENDSLIEKMEKHLQSKCYCHSKLTVDTSRVVDLFSLY